MPNNITPAPVAPAFVTSANSGIGQAMPLGLPQIRADVIVNCVTNREAANYVTSAPLFVDGGMTMYPGFSSGG